MGSEGRVMTIKEKLLVLWLFVMVIVAFVVTHIAGHLAFVIENCLAIVLAVLRP
jgi:putative flippase GtrA